jgi:signal transduction histidine kinase
VTSYKDRGVIRVTDDGPGIADSEIARAMEPGVRVDETVPGHGFGLSIAKELCEIYGGSIALRPAQNSGLVVVVDLPLEVL